VAPAATGAEAGSHRAHRVRGEYPRRPQAASAVWAADPTPWVVE